MAKGKAWISHALRHSAMALVAVVAAALLRKWVLGALETRIVWVTFYPAVVLASLYGGAYTGILTSLLSCLLTIFAWSFFGSRPFIQVGADWLGLAAFLVNCILISVVADMSRRANGRLRSALDLQRQSQAVLDAVPNLVYALDPEGRFIMANKSLAVLLGTTPEAMIGKPRETWLPADIAADHRSADLKVMALGEACEFEERNQEGDGEHIYQSVKFPMRDESGQTVALGGISTDITRMIRAEMRTREALQNWTTTFDAMKDAVCLLDLEGHILRHNKAWQDLLGSDKVTQKGRICHEILHNCPGFIADCPFQRMLGTGKRESTEFRMQGNWYEAVADPLIGPDGAITGAVHILHDMTKRKKAEEDRQRITNLYAALSQANQAIVRAKSKNGLFEESVRVCVEFGHFDLAWIGVPDETGERVRIAAAQGPCRQYTEGLEIILGADLATGRGPTGTCFREARPVVSQDWDADPSMEPWRKRAASYSIRSSAAFPLLQDGRPAAVLCLYSLEPDFFQEDRLELLSKMAGDLGYALDALAEEERRIRAEVELQASEERFRLSFDHASIGKSITGLDGRLLRVNEAFGRMLGYERSELEASTFAQITHPDDVDATIAWVQKLVSRELASAHFEKRYLHKDGHTVWADVSTVLLWDPASKEPQHLITHVVDITERKLAELASLASETRYRRLFESAKDGILILDAETGMIVDVNPFLMQLLGYSIEAFLGKRVWELGFFQDIIPNQENFQALKANEYIRYEDMPLETSSGQRIEVEFVSNVYLVNDQRVIQCNIRDISERIQTQREIHSLNASLEHKVQERTAQLQSANQELEAFAYSISHDLKAPLRSVAGFSQAIIEDFGNLLPAQGQEYLQCVQDEALRMGHLVDDLLRLSRLGQQALSIEEVDLTALAHSILKNLAAGDPERQVHWELDPDLKIHGDPILLRVVLENLLGNAWKFTSKTLEARIQVRRSPCDPGWSQFLISDNGAGFDPADADRLFTPFRRLHSVDEFPGTGIGLAIVRRVVHRHGASIKTEGAPGKGAVFTLMFPIPDVKP
jgi:PAS domain S-box-containing protein